MSPPETEPPPSFKEAADYRKAAYETLNPGAHYAGRQLRRPTKKRAPADLIFVKRPEGEDLEELIQAILRTVTGDWKSLCLLAHEVGMDFHAGRQLKWCQFTDETVSWESVGGRHEVAVTQTLAAHLKTVPRNAAYVCPSVALIPHWSVQYGLKVACAKLKASYRKIIRRFSVSRMMVDHYHQLVARGLRPAPAFSNACRDPKERVRRNLVALLEDSADVVPHTAIRYASPYREIRVEELKSLVKNSQGEWPLVIMVLFYLPISAGRLCRMTWENFDLIEGFARYAGGQKVPLHPALFRFLRNCPGEKSGKLVHHASASQLALAAEREIRRAGITDLTVRLSSIRKTAFTLFKQANIVLNQQGMVVLNSSFSDEATTEVARFVLLKKALLSFPDILASSAGEPHT